MAWTTPRTWTPGEVVSASQFNTHIRDNLNFLLSGRPQDYKRTGGAYSTGSTTFVDVDATNLILNLTLVGSRVLVVCFVTFFTASNVAGNYGALDVIVDSTTRQGDATFGLTTTGQAQNFSTGFVKIITGLSAGAHTFKLQYKCGAAASTAGITAPTNGAATVTFAAVEV